MAARDHQHKNVQKSRLCGFEQAPFWSLQCLPERSPLWRRAVSSIMQASAYRTDPINDDPINSYELHFA